MRIKITDQLFIGTNDNSIYLTKFYASKEDTIVISDDDIKKLIEKLTEYAKFKNIDICQ